MSLDEAIKKLNTNYRGANCIVQDWIDKQNQQLIDEIWQTFEKNEAGHYVIYRAVKSLTDVPMNVKTFVTHFRGDCRCSRTH